MPDVPPPRRPWYRILYVQVLLGVVAGIVVGHFHPSLGVALQPLGEGFIKLIKMLIAPIIFCTVVHGIASLGDLKKLGRIGWKTLVYFEVVSTFALIIGLVVVNIARPGDGLQIQTKITPEIQKKIDVLKDTSAQHSVAKFFLDLIPKSFFEPFANGNLLQILLVAILTAFAISMLGQRGPPILAAVDSATHLFFALLRILVQLAPLGAFGAMAATVGEHGLEVLWQLGYLMVAFYVTAALFVIGVLGLIARFAGFSIWRLLQYIKEELLLVLGTSSSETALPGIMKKMERLGCAESTVGVVIPTGYSFNLDGTNIYLTMAAVFLAQVQGIELSISQQLGIIFVAMLTSKGSSGVTGAGFVTLMATLSSTQVIPVESIGILFGIDRFMSECRSLTNLVGNSVATVVISRWEGELSAADLQRNLRREVSDTDE